MEKKRRARINDSLESLKKILLESKTNLKSSSRSGQRTAKLEKADILEMTVRYLQQLHVKTKDANFSKYDNTKIVTIRSSAGSLQNTDTTSRNNEDGIEDGNLARRNSGVTTDTDAATRGSVITCRKKEVAIRPADSSCDSFKKVSLPPIQGISGEIVYVFPGNIQVFRRKKYSEKFNQTNSELWRPW